MDRNGNGGRVWPRKELLAIYDDPPCHLSRYSALATDVEMTDPENLFHAIRDKISPNGESFKLGHAIDAIELAYANAGSIDIDDALSLVVVAGKFDDEDGPWFDIGMYPSFSLFQPFEILLHYPLGWRNWLLGRLDSRVLEFPQGFDTGFATIRQSKWFRRYRNVLAIECICRVRTDDEMQEFAMGLAMASQDGL